MAIGHIKGGQNSYKHSTDIKILIIYFLKENLIEPDIARIIKNKIFELQLFSDNKFAEISNI